ncbi:DNA repair protein RecN [Peptoniphilus sp.]|jgi:DNA repair protein RecN (Recombination protein N)|uniref:DNA repair protein RecN n=1 Tax=Peptoniphilus sp. TaxID=1971214 RepID=UPI003D908EA7
MLLELNIENFAIIENMKISFDRGLNVLTGETGSGKSIIIDSLGLVLGARANKDIIKYGEDYAYIEAIFSCYSEDIKKTLKEYGFDIGELIVISKKIQKDGPTITRINNRAVTSGLLSKIAVKLIDIFAQHETISLMDNKNQLKLIDDFCGEDHKILLKELESLVNEINRLKKEYDEKNSLETNKEREIDLLEYQINEIDEASLTEYDENGLAEDFNKYSNMTNSIMKLTEAKSIIDSSYESANIEDILDKVIGNVSEVSKIDKDINYISEELEDIRYRLTDISRDLGNYIDSMEIDEEQLNFLQNRIDLVNSIKAKYGKSLDEINKFYDETYERLEFLKNFEKNLAKLHENIISLEKKAYSLSEKITKNRNETANLVQEKITNEIKELNIPNAKFKIKITEKELSSDGKDKIEFLISPNKGQDLMPMAKVASGGEMSRIMLGFKSIIAQKDNIPTLVFDEIDTGISGKTAQIVGRKIKKLSKGRQIIVISHLPQIVALADTHFVINKDIVNETTISKIAKLNDDERVEELARLIGGDNITSYTLATAKEMIGDEAND